MFSFCDFSLPPPFRRSTSTLGRGTRRDITSTRGGRKWTWVKNNLSLPVSKSTIFGIILAVGLTVGAGLLVAHSGGLPYSSWIHDIAIGGTALFGTSTLAGIIYTGKNYYDRYQRMKTRPGLFPDIEEQTRPPQNRNMARVRDNIRLDSDTFNTRLQLATKMDKDGGLHRGSRANAVYYDLTQSLRDVQNPIADELDLGDQGTFLQIPHIGKHESGYLHNDHYMAVRLPSSQLEKFPQPIQRDMAGIENPEIFFMVFKRPAGAEDGIYDLALQAMALDNYDHTDPLNPTGGLRKGQSTIHLEGGGEGLQTTMQIRMRNTVGIDLYYSVGPERDPAALTGDAKIVHPSIHTDSSDAHRFSDKHARIKVDEAAPVSCFDISAKTSDGRGIVLRALIINDEKSNDGKKVLKAVRTDSLKGFLDRIVNGGNWEPPNLSFGLSSSHSEEFAQQILGFSGEANGQRPFANTKSTRDASKLPEDEGEKPKTQVPKLDQEIIDKVKGVLIPPAAPSRGGLTAHKVLDGAAGLLRGNLPFG